MYDYYYDYYYEYYYDDYYYYYYYFYYYYYYYYYDCDLVTFILQRASMSPLSAVVVSGSTQSLALLQARATARPACLQACSKLVNT